MTAKTKEHPRMKLLRKLRRSVKVSTRFSVELLPDGREKQTCRTCGKSEIKDIYAKCPPEFAKKLVAYRNSGAGLYVVCKNCSKIRAKERYPSPKDD